MAKMDYDALSGAARTTRRHVNASDFFHSLRGKAKQIAREESVDMANNMKYILSFRQQLEGGNGRYPKAENDSKFSHRHWAIKRQSEGEWWLVNSAINPVDSFNYPRLLVSGKGWSEKVTKNAGGIKSDGTPSNLVKVGDRYFSKQMPRGLEPWLKIKRDEMENKIRARMKKEM